MRVYIVQYKLVSDGEPCVPYTYTERKLALLQCDLISAMTDVYSGVKLCSIDIPRYTERIGAVVVEVERTF